VNADDDDEDEENSEYGIGGMPDTAIGQDEGED